MSTAGWIRHILSPGRKLGCLYVFTGVMRSGKTSAALSLLSQVASSAICGNHLGEAVIIKKAVDVRGELGEEEGSGSTHGGRKFKCVRVENLKEFVEAHGKDYGVLLIDDGQFFHGSAEQKGSSIADVCDKVVNESNKVVIVATLDSDFNREPFEHISRLCSKADGVMRMGCCSCMGCHKDLAVFNHKVQVPGSSSDGGERYEVGSSKYKSLCRSCWVSETRNQSVAGDHV